MNTEIRGSSGLNYNGNATEAEDSHVLTPI